MDIRKGQRLALLDVVGNASVFQVSLEIGGIAVDFACFGLDSGQRLANDAYMTFFNQPKTPCGSVELTAQNQGAAVFECRLGHLPYSIDRLVFTATVDGDGSLNAVANGALTFLANQHEHARFAFTGQDFLDEKAVMVGELYRKDGGWRFAANGQGFNGGLAALVQHFGGVVAETEPTAKSKVPLEKKIAETAPKLVSLAKKATLSLEKHRLTDIVARAGLVLDASGSMRRQYQEGKVQSVIDRLLPLAVHFDDDGALDIWAFSSKVKSLPPATVGNYADYIDSTERGWKNWGLMSVNNEPAVIKQAIAHFKDSQLPVFIIFISDGGISKNSEIKKLLTEAAALPIFWQFVGIGGHNYGVLEKLDTMTGRIVDNCGFFALDHLDSVSEQELYDLLLGEFPLWLKAARQRGIVN